jgi:hypothetical protein
MFNLPEEMNPSGKSSRNPERDIVIVFVATFSIPAPQSSPLRTPLDVSGTVA